MVFFKNILVFSSFLCMKLRSRDINISAYHRWKFSIILKRSFFQKFSQIFFDDEWNKKTRPQIVAPRRISPSFGSRHSSSFLYSLCIIPYGWNNIIHINGMKKCQYFEMRNLSLFMAYFIGWDEDHLFHQIKNRWAEHISSSP